MKVIRSIAAAVVIAAALLAAGCTNPAATVPDKLHDSPIAARDSFIAADANSKEVAVAFVEALGNGRVDRANALASAPVYRISDEASAGVVDVSTVGEPGMANSAGWPVLIEYTVVYSAQKGSERFPKGPGRALVSLAIEKEGASPKVLGIRVVD